MDALRGLAALAVVLCHWRNLFFVDLQEIPRHRALLTPLYFSTGFGHQAVMVFFVLSGFLISSSVLKMWSEQRWSWSLYLTNRCTRLYIVLIPALLIGGFWDRLGTRLFGSLGIYGGHAGGSNVISWDVLSRGGSGILLGNYFFLQDIFVPTFGSNGPLWSLSYEFWYYMMFPLFVFATLLRKQKRKLLLSVAGGAALLVFVGSNIALYFSIWLMGAAVAVLPPPAVLQRGWRMPAFIATSLVLLLGSLTMTRFKFLSEFLADFLLGSTCAVFLYALLHLREGRIPAMYSRISRALANSSYTLYLVHLPFLVFLRAWLVPDGRWNPDLPHLAMGTALACLVVAYAFAIAAVTEARTGKVRRTVMERLGLASRERTLVSVKN